MYAFLNNFPRGKKAHLTTAGGRQKASTGYVVKFERINWNICLRSLYVGTSNASININVLYMWLIINFINYKQIAFASAFCTFFAFEHARIIENKDNHKMIIILSSP